MLLGVSSLPQQRGRLGQRHVVRRMRRPLLAGLGQRVRVSAHHADQLHVAPHRVAAGSERERGRSRAVCRRLRILRVPPRPATDQGDEPRAECRRAGGRRHRLRLGHPHDGAAHRRRLRSQSHRHPPRLLRHLRLLVDGRS